VIVSEERFFFVTPLTVLVLDTVLARLLLVIILSVLLLPLVFGGACLAVESPLTFGGGAGFSDAEELRATAFFRAAMVEE